MLEQEIRAEETKLGIKITLSHETEPLGTGNIQHTLGSLTLTLRDG